MFCGSGQLNPGLRKSTIFQQNVFYTAEINSVKISLFNEVQVKSNYALLQKKLHCMSSTVI